MMPSVVPRAGTESRHTTELEETSMPRSKQPRKRYTPAQKRRILSVARKEGLTGAQVRERFGVSLLTFYRWRGPVGRGRRVEPGGGIRRRGRGAVPRPPHGLLETAEIDVVALREEVRRALHLLLPQVVQEELEAYLAALLRSA
jgi:transposase-like protein